jgi:AraC-like DNA-binding protein
MKVSYLNLHDLVWAITFVECILLIAILKVLPATRSQPRNLLALFLLQMAGILATNIFIWNLNFHAAGINNSVVAPVVLSACILLQGPTLYWYLRSLTQDVDLLQWKHSLHLIPAVVVCLVIIGFDIDSQAWLPWIELPPAQAAAVSFVWAVVRCFPFFYVLACLLMEYRVRREIRQRYSTFSRLDLNLSYLILGGYFIHWLWSLVGYFIGDYISGNANDMMGIIDNYLSVLLVNALFIFGLLNSRQVMASTEPDMPADANRLADIANIEEKIHAVEQGIRKRKLYLDSHINLERFAEQIGVRAREVSEILNSHYQQNFFEFINHYRVDEAKRLLSATDTRDTILDIVYKSGFNSQSAFHRFFKRLVGMTPSEYRKKTAAQERVVKPV